MNHEMRAAADITVAMINAWIEPEDFVQPPDGTQDGAWAPEHAGNAASIIYETIYRKIRELEAEFGDSSGQVS